MINERDIFEKSFRRYEPEGGSFERLVRRRDRKRRNQRITAGVVGIAVFVAAVWIVTSGLSLDRSETSVVPGGDVTGPAETGPAEPEGHTATYATTLSLHARPKSLCRPCGGREVHFTGHLRSPHTACVAHSTVKLILEASAGVWETKTNAEGRYAFVLTSPRGDWHVRFSGKVLGSEASRDHRWCDASESPQVHVVVWG
jgi:hypothetical protein